VQLFEHPERLLVAASLVFGLGMAAVTPPFQVPDEPDHFQRAYLVSEGRLRLRPSDQYRAELPASLPRLSATLLGQMPFPSRVEIAPRAVLDALAVPLAPERRETVFMPSSLQYTFVPYVAPALGIAVARGLGAPALALLYAARLGNLIAGTLAIYAAIRLLPALRWPAVLAAMMPMTLALRASASVDATTICAAFLATAATARLIWGTSAPRRRELVALLGSTAVLCASKPPYLPLALLVCLVPAERWPARRRAPLLAVYFAALAALAAWSVESASRTVGLIYPGGGVDPEGQIAVMLAHPFRFLQLVVIDYGLHGARYLRHFVGHLGWLDVGLPTAFLGAYLALLLVATVLDSDGEVRVTLRQRIFVGAVVVVCLVLVSASQYASFTPLGAAAINGIQGRYYIPLAPAAMWALRDGQLAPSIASRAMPAAVATFVALAFALAVRALLEQFYGI
jgi:uncharacterized membrane protein